MPADSASTRRPQTAFAAPADALFRALVEGAPDAVVVEREGRIVFANAAAARLFAAGAPAALVGRATLDLVHPAYRPLVEGRVRQAIAGETVPLTQPRLVRLDGRELEAEVAIAPVALDEGCAVQMVLRAPHPRRRAEVELRHQALVFDALSDAVVVADLEGRVVEWNPAAERLHGYARSEMLGRRVRDIVPAELAGQFDEVVRTTRAEGRWAGELPLVRGDGTRGISDTVVVVQCDAQGRPARTIAVSRDITERKRGERALRDSELLFAGIVAAQEEIATSRLDADTVMLRAVVHAQQLTGAAGATVELVEGEELVYRAGGGMLAAFDGLRLRRANTLSGRCIAEREILRCDDAETDPRVDREACRRTGIRSMIATPLFHDDRPVAVLKVVSPAAGAFDDRAVRTLQLLAGVAGAAISNAASFAEKQALVAERTAALASLRHWEAHFRSLIESAVDPIIIIDATAQLVYASPAYERALGFPLEEALGHEPLAHVHPDDIPRAREALARVLERPGQPVTIELRLSHADGSPRTFSCDARNLIADPAVGGIVVNLHDVTDQKLLAAQLRQAQRLEAIGQLAGGVAHDFNNILTVIKVHGEMLAGELDPRDPRREDVEEIRRAAERAAALTRQLLAFSRKQILQPKPLDLNAVVAGLEPMLRRLIGEDIEMATLAGVGEARVVADPGQLEQVLVNLAVNARDAMPGGGALSIETQRVTLDDDYVDRHEVVVPGEYVMLAVSDTGYGMTPETRARIFEPFFTTKEPGKGTGLGLATVYGIVKQSGGYIWVYSEPTLGTTFKIYLPWAPPGGVAVAERTSVPLPVPCGTETVLLVEDEEAVRALARRILQRQGYQVLEARHGADAVQVAERHGDEIHLVLTDMVMPQMGGRELVERLTAHRPRLRWLFMSGYTDDDIVRRGLLDATHRAFLQKPFTTEGLCQAVRRTLDDP